MPDSPNDLNSTSPYSSCTTLLLTIKPTFAFTLTPFSPLMYVVSVESGASDGVNFLTLAKSERTPVESYPNPALLPVAKNTFFP